MPEVGGRRFEAYMSACVAASLKAVHRLRDPIQLYDLGTDPKETTDVAARHPDVIAFAQKVFASGRTESEFFPSTGTD